MRITSKDVRERLKQANEMNAIRRKMQMEVWSPGDHGTRYKLKDSETWHDLSPALSGREMYHALGILMRVADNHYRG